jgi:hypothetical protein
MRAFESMLTSVAFVVLPIAFIGCGQGEVSPDTRPSPYAAYQPTSGQNLSPGIAPYAHGDPEWPMDIARGGGGGRR